jgi:multidrug efflux pump subunit AcrA (membrane-fusion protein)
MRNIEVKKRGWVKNAAIIFLAVMLVLTFFSNTIMNRSLPEIASQFASSGSITARIRNFGTVTANEIFEVKTDRTRQVLEVPVRVGDVVGIGDVLVVFSGDISDDLQAAQDALHELELRLERMLLEISRPDGTLANSNRAVQQARSDLTEAQRARDRIPYSEAAINQAQDALNQAQNSLNQAQNSLNQAQAGLIGPQIALDAAIAILHDKEEAVAAAWDRLVQLLVLDPDDSVTIDQARQAFADAEAARDTAREAVNDARTVYDIANEPVINAQLAISIAQAAVDQSQTQLNTQLGYRSEWISANDFVRQCQQNLDRLIADLFLTQGGIDVDNSLEAINLRELRREIQEKEDEIADLEKDDGSSELKALVGGIITTRLISPGDQAVAGDVLMTIENTDRGYSLSFEVTADQARRVSIGDQAEVDRGWYWGSLEIRATLVSIRNNPQNPTTGRILTFSITGDVEGGDQLNLTLNQRSENYNIIVPNSAIRSDTNGDFVLIVMSRSSPLGNRYVAQRADVNILATDDTHTAVSGALANWDSVITHSSRPINPGDQVRLTDNP